jgi:[protein-PII] uridylyltransferase
MLVQDASFAKLPKSAPYEFESRLESMPPLTGDVKADFASLRGYVEAVHQAGGSGHTVVRLLSAAMDRIVTAVWENALASAATHHAATPVALIAGVG